MVTKQEQLEWLANKIVKWPDDVEVIEVATDQFGKPMFWFSCWGEGGIKFTKEEWQREQGICHSTKEAAIANAKAMLGIASNE